MNQNRQKEWDEITSMRLRNKVVIGIAEHAVEGFTSNRSRVSATLDSQFHGTDRFYGTEAVHTYLKKQNYNPAYDWRSMSYG